MPTGLAHVTDQQYAASALFSYSNSFSVGPLTIQYSVDTQNLQISIEVDLLGVTIGSGTLSAANPSLTLNGGVAGFKAEVTLAASFSQRQATYAIELCAPILGCTDYNGVLVSW
jgi:hypothetical protein